MKSIMSETNDRKGPLCNFLFIWSPLNADLDIPGRKNNDLGATTYKNSFLCQETHTIHKGVRYVHCMYIVHMCQVLSFPFFEAFYLAVFNFPLAIVAILQKKRSSDSRICRSSLRELKIVQSTLI